MDEWVTRAGADSRERTNEQFPIIGIGASAGGLDALERFFRAVPENSGMAFVVVQHLSRDFRSVMDELLARHTRLPIATVEDGMKLEPNRIYLMPAGTEMILSSDCLRLTERARDQELTLPIDQFFRSLAQELGPDAIAVVLSGTGTDGARGVREVVRAGGLVIVQSPETAEFDGMPVAAIQASEPAHVLAPGEIPRELVRSIERGDRLRHSRSEARENEDSMQVMFRLLQDEYGIDFSYYKPATIMRRIDRRLMMTGMPDLAAYLEQIVDSPRELSLLYHDLLIEVTQFFRDPAAFNVLESLIVPEVLAATEHADEIRIWCTACATGEEPYSVGMVVRDALRNHSRDIPVKIFATDVHRESLEVASIGIYPQNRLRGVSRERRERYFLEKNDGFHVSPQLREMVVFAPHNVLRDAPFTNMDLIVCRNLLIYLGPSAQKKVLSLFHFGLKVGMPLWLGPSETPGELAEEFDTLDQHWKFFRKRRDVRLVTHLRTPVVTGRAISPVSRVVPGGLSSSELLETYDQLLSEYMPAALLLNENRSLAHAFGEAGRYLRFGEGRPSLDVLDNVVPELRLPLATGLTQAAKREMPVTFAGIRVTFGDKKEEIRLTVRPLRGRLGAVGRMFVTFESAEFKPDDDDEVIDVSAEPRDHYRQLEKELDFTKQHLQATIEESEATNEELQASNEELVASNEELQSTNEELHSVNEELHTVNSEYQRKIAELTQLTDDMENLLATTNVDTIFLDQDLIIRRFTPGVTRLFSFIPQDVGRRFDSFTHHIADGTVLQEVPRVRDRAKPFEKEVADRQGNWYLLRIFPYLSNSTVAGIVITFVDISTLKAAQTRLEELSDIVEQCDDAILRTNLDGIVQTWNRGAVKLYGYSVDEMIGESVTRLETPANSGCIVEALQKVREGRIPERLDVEHSRTNGKKLAVSLTISPIRDSLGKICAASIIAHDVTEQKLAETTARDAVRRRDEFLAMLSHELRNPLGAILTATQVLEHFDLDTTVKNSADAIARQARQMARLLDDLLDVARVTQGKVVLRREHFDLRELVAEAVEVVAAPARQRDLELVTDVTSTPVWILGDRSRLLQAAQNLLRNSVKYTPPGEKIFLSLSSESGSAVLSVADTGIGIDMEFIPRVFDLFVQSDESLDRSEGGMGVGLTLVKGVVDMHHGTVEAYSEGPGRGSEFVIRIPLAAPPETAPTSSCEDGTPPRISRVVVIEDMEDNRELLASLLKLEGLEVETAADGLQGIELIESFKPDLALVDIGLPEMNGFEVARKVRQNPENKSVQLVALTGYGRDSDRAAVREAGFDGHLVKPLQRKDLANILTNRVGFDSHSSSTS